MKPTEVPASFAVALSPFAVAASPKAVGACARPGAGGATATAPRAPGIDAVPQFAVKVPPVSPRPITEKNYAKAGETPNGTTAPAASASPRKTLLKCELRVSSLRRDRLRAFADLPLAVAALAYSAALIRHRTSASLSPFALARRPASEL